MAIASTLGQKEHSMKASEIFDGYFNFFAEQESSVFADYTNAALWTLRATTALVHVGLKAFPGGEVTAKGHASGNPWMRSEYLTLEEPLRRLAAPIAGEDVRDVLLAVLVGRDKGPHESVLRLTGAVVLHQEARLVGADDRSDSNLLDESLPQRLGQLACSVQQVVHRRAREWKSCIFGRS